MADIGIIDFDSITENTGFSAIPAADYTVSITGSEVSDNKKGNGKYVKFTFQVLNGPHKGRLLWHYVNFKHVNPQVQTIGQRELKELGLACGKQQYTDTSVLHGIPFRVRVAVERDDRGEDRNVVKRVLWKETAGAAPAARPAAGGIESDDVPF